MNPLHEKRRALGHAKACFGGDSSSTSTSIQNTVNTNNDNRSVVANDSHDTNTNTNSGNSYFSNWDIGRDVSISNSGNTISGSYNTSTTTTTVTDLGAVSGALAANRDSTSMVLALTQKLTEGTNAVLQKNQSLTQELAGTTNAAYAGAAQQASGTNTFIFVAVGVVALAAILMRKG